MHYSNIAWSMSRAQSAALAIVLVVSLAVPLLRPGLPPLIDLLGHVGRYHVQVDIAHSAALQRYFTVQWRLLPNLGVDLGVIALAPVIGLEAAVKAIVTMIPVATGAGLLLISREIHGRVLPTSIFALPLAYAWPFQAGFVNYALAMAIALLAFGFWLRLDRQGRRGLRAALFLIIAPLIWVAHIYGWAVLCVLAFLSGFVTARQRATSWTGSGLSAGVSCLPLAIPLLMILLWHQQGTGATTDWFNLKMVATWLLTILRDRWQAFDAASALLLYALAATPVILRRYFMFEWRLAVPAAALWVLAVLIPNTLSGSYFAGVRLIPFALALTLVSIRWGTAAGPRVRQLLAITGLLFFAVRIGAQTIDFRLADAANRSTLTALDHVATGARIVTLVGQTCGRWLPSRHLHLPEIATARRDAFTNGHWDMAGGQVISVAYKAGAPFVSDPSQFVNVSGCGDRFPTAAQSFARVPLSAFDYLWMVEVPSAEWPKNARLTPIWFNGRSVLYRINPGAGSAR